MTFVLSIDHGNGNVKACSDDKMILLPSMYARPEEFGEDSFINPKKMELFKFQSSKYKDETFFWGKDVKKASKVIATYGGEGRYLSKPYQLLSEFTMSLLLPNKETRFDDVIIVTGCPSGAVGTHQEEELKNVFQGKHVVTVNGITKAFNVSNVYVLPQPLGTIFYMYLDNEGNVADEAYEADYVGVIDIGNGTTDIDGVKGLKRQLDDISTIQSGMFDAYKKIANYINRVNPHANATPQSVELQILKPEIDANTYKISNRVPPIDISQIKEKVYRELAEEIINHIHQIWPNRTKFDRLLLTGGGAKPLADYFLEWEKDIQLVENGQQSNAIGFYRYGLLKTLAFSGQY